MAQYYEDDRYLEGAIAEWVRIGISAGEAVVLVATQEHWMGVTTELSKTGVDIHGLVSSRRLIHLNAHDTLLQIMPDGVLVPELFARHVGDTVASVYATAGRVRCFGELVNILSAQGRSDDVRALEGLWNTFIRSHPGVTLLCGYNVGHLRPAAQDQVSQAALWAIAEAHSRVIPPEELNSCPEDFLYQRVAALELRSAVLREETAEKQRLKRELESAKAALAEAGKMTILGELCAGIAHELNNPIAIVAGSTRAAKNMAGKIRYDAESTEASLGLTKHLAVIEDASMRMAKIVKDVLTFSHRHETQTKVQFSLQKSLMTVMEIVREAFAEADIALRFNLPTQELFVNGNSTLMEQVFLNLVYNARDAIVTARKNDPRRVGILTLTTATGADQTIQVLFQDNGCGMDLETQRRVFLPFFTTKPVGRGTGLGLSLSQSIVVTHGGSMTCSSTPGQGATFTITLPMSEVSQGSKTILGTRLHA